ncbi:MAG: type VI secretion system baseplate subunit TssK [Pseudomonadota bacterium]
MTTGSKPMWVEGMLVRPQHFQQLERYVEAQREARLISLLPFQWGVRRLAIDQSLLPAGRIGLSSVSGVFPDGTPFDAPDHDLLPDAREVPAETVGQRVFLAVPLVQAHQLQVANLPPRSSSDRLDPRVRYHSVDVDARDATDSNGGSAPITVGLLKPRLLFDTEPTDGLVAMPIARVLERQDSGQVVLSESFLPPAMECEALPLLRQLIREVANLLRYRGVVLASRVDPSARGQRVGGVADLLVLQVVNRYAPLLAHYASRPALHPITVYELFIQLLGELRTFVGSERVASKEIHYLHDDLEGVFDALGLELRKALSAAAEDAAISLPLQHRGRGFYVSPIADRGLLDVGRFVIAADAEIDSEVLRRRFPAQVKIGPVEAIGDLVNLQLTGIAAQPMPVAPREIPYRTGATYFELDRKSEIWRRLSNSAAFAIHVSGEFPGLELEFWAIPEQQVRA